MSSPEPGPTPRERTHARPLVRITRRALVAVGVIGTAGLIVDRRLSPSDDPSPPRPSPTSDLGQTDLPHWPSSLPVVPAVGEVDRAAFAPQEQVMGGFLVTAADLANSVSAARARYGWFSSGLWRRPTTPDNARIQENVATLAWFYSQDRSWNVYHGSPEMLVRLYASTSYYLSLQLEDGSFPDSEGNSNRAVVGFALTYLAQTSLLMEDTGWNPQLQASLDKTLLRASEWFLDPRNAAVWDSAVYTSNQVAAGLLGVALASPRLTPRQRERLAERIPVFLERSSSSVGYLYESRTVDFGYTTTVTLGDMAQLYTLTGDSTLAEAAERFFDFSSYNYLWEPDGVGHVINGAIGSRIPARFLDSTRPDDTSNTDMLALWAPRIPLSAAFVSTAEGKDRLRQEWARDPARPPVLDQVNPAYPRSVLASLSFPTESERDAALRSFRYRRENEFVEERRDATFDQTFLYVRRTTYYASAFWGRRYGDQQRSGPGFLYHPDTGTFVCSQPLPDLAWRSSATGFDEALVDLEAKRSSVQDAESVQLTVRDRPDFKRRLIWRADQIEVIVDGGRDLVEHVPLVLRDDDLVSWLTSAGSVAVTGDGEQTRVCKGVQVSRGSHRLEIEFSERSVTLHAPAATLFAADVRRVRRLDLSHRGQSVAYTLRIRP